MKIKIKIFLLLFTFLAACTGKNNEKGNNQIKDSTVIQEHNHEDESEVIELDNGKKWKVDSNMIIHIRNMEKDVISFTKVEKKDYKSLTEKLKSNIDILTSNCTMKGKAHDELHKWLLPYIDLVDELAKAKDENEALKKFGKIQNSFTMFNVYFE